MPMIQRTFAYLGDPDVTSVEEVDVVAAVPEYNYIHAEKLRHTNTETTAALARPGRYKSVAGNPRVKEVHDAPGAPVMGRAGPGRRAW